MRPLSLRVKRDKLGRSSIGAGYVVVTLVIAGALIAAVRGPAKKAAAA